MICKNDLYDLLDESFSYVICNDSGDKLEELFYRSIEENKDNFVVFKDQLEIIKDILKEDLQFFMDSDPAAHSLLCEPLFSRGSSASGLSEMSARKSANTCESSYLFVLIVKRCCCVIASPSDACSVLTLQR